MQAIYNLGSVLRRGAVAGSRLTEKEGPMKNDSRPVLASGLEGVISAETRLSAVDGEAGELIIAGFPVEELASRASFEEVVYLLWHDALPRSEELASFREELAARRALPGPTLGLLRAAAAERGRPIDALRIAAGKGR